MENVFAQTFKRNDTNKYIQIREKNVTYTEDKLKATTFTIENLDPIDGCPCLCWYMRFNIVYMHHDDPANKLFLVCKNNEELTLISEAEHTANGYQWNLLMDANNCHCYSKCNHECNLTLSMEE
jgi:hypothetical protein